MSQISHEDRARQVAQEIYEGRLNSYANYLASHRNTDEDGDIELNPGPPKSNGKPQNRRKKRGPKKEEHENNVELAIHRPEEMKNAILDEAKVELVEAAVVATAPKKELPRNPETENHYVWVSFSDDISNIIPAHRLSNSLEHFKTTGHVPTQDAILEELRMTFVLPKCDSALKTCVDLFSRGHSYVEGKTVAFPAAFLYAPKTALVAEILIFTGMAAANTYLKMTSELDENDAIQKRWGTHGLTFHSVEVTACEEQLGLNPEDMRNYVARKENLLAHPTMHIVRTQTVSVPKHTYGWFNFGCAEPKCVAFEQEVKVDLTRLFGNISMPNEFTVEGIRRAIDITRQKVLRDRAVNGLPEEMAEQQIAGVPLAGAIIRSLVSKTLIDYQGFHNPLSLKA